MSEKTAKTNAARLLDREKVVYELVPYEVDESDLSAVHVARQMGEPAGRIFKTLVLRGNVTGYFVCIVPGDAELDLKHAAKATGNKNCDMIPMKDLLGVTGYIRGACSPIGMKKRFPTFIDGSCRNFETIYVSAGRRGLQIRVAPEDLVRIAEATVTRLIPEAGRPKAAY